MVIEADMYTIDDRIDWQKFLKGSNNGTIFHSLDFLNYHPKGKFNEHHLIFRKKGNIIALLPGAIFKTHGGLEYHSPYGASYGSFIISKPITLNDSMELVDCFLDYSKGLNIKTIYMTLVPYIYWDNPYNHLEYALIERGFKYYKRQLTSALDLKIGMDDILYIFKKKARNAVRKAQKSGTYVKESDDYEAFYNILLVNKKERHEAEPTHTLEELTYLKSNIPNGFKLYLAYKDKIPIGGVHIFICNPRALLTFYICHLPKYEELRPINLLLYEIINKEIKNNYKYLDLGTSHTIGNEFNWGLIKFKESLSTNGYFKDTLQWIDRS